jgi:hypothetical protein
MAGTSVVAELEAVQPHHGVATSGELRARGAAERAEPGNDEVDMLDRADHR